MSLISQIFAEIDAAETAAPSIGSAAANLNLSGKVTLANGTGSGNADTVYTGKRTIAGSSSENLDLNGVLADVFGNTINAAKVKAILIVADAANAGDLVVGNAASNPFVGPLGGTNPTISARPGGLLLVADPGAGWTVTPATGDLLKIANSGASAATYKISIIASSV